MSPGRAVPARRSRRAAARRVARPPYVRRGRVPGHLFRALQPVFIPVPPTTIDACGSTGRGIV